MAGDTREWRKYMGEDKCISEKNGLTERQKREKEYYETYIGLINTTEVSFDPIDGKCSRPWNPYWYVYSFVKDYYSKERNKLLDFGCGSGITSVRFAKIGYEVSGFDISESSIGIGNALAMKYEFGNKIKLTQQVAENLNYPSNYFDIIVGFDILHHVDIKAAINECRRVLKKDGIAIFKEPVESPVLDKIRNTTLVKMIVPKEKSFNTKRHITQDEKKLNVNDISILKEYFGNVIEESFTLLSRLDFVFRSYYKKRSSPLEIIDYNIFKYIPCSRKYGGDTVFVLSKG
jgi:ubiquinone/menaquinone biosynthesis C-methylase UbiE